MNGRRNFVKGLGLWSAFAAGAVAAGRAGANTVLDGPALHDFNSNVASQNIDHLAPPDDALSSVLSIQGRYGEQKPPPVQYDPFGEQVYFFQPSNVEVTNTLHMTVGKDDRLWIKVGDKWKRVALES